VPSVAPSAAAEISGQARPRNSAPSVDASASVEIVGEARPEDSMSKESTIQKVTMARGAIRGLKKRFGPNVVIVLWGKKWKRKDLVALLESHLAAIEEKRKRKAAYEASVAAEKALARRVLPLLLGLRRSVNITFGGGALAEFDMKRYGKPGPKTTAAKLAGVEKRAAKRAKG
jgi:hypothetical protein